MTSFKVSKTDEGQRADIFVASRYPDFTRSSLERLFDKGLVTTAQSPLKAGQKLHAGQKITVDDHLLRVVPPAIDLPVIYEDDNVIVIDKPAGVLTHSKGALNSESTVASFISDRISPELTGNRAGIVHRLDRATSGVIITAKNSATQKYLQKQFSTRKVIKTYLAIVEGEPEPAQAIVDAPIARNPAKPQTFKVAATGKPAVTEYKVLKILNKSSILYSLVELKPRTGRTHQIRVHMAYIGHPIVGDSIYGKPNDGLLLHAESLEVTLPGGKRRHFSAKIPRRIKEFENA